MKYYFSVISIIKIFGFGRLKLRVNADFNPLLDSREMHFKSKYNEGIELEKWHERQQ